MLTMSRRSTAWETPQTQPVPRSLLAHMKLSHLQTLQTQSELHKRICTSSLSIKAFFAADSLAKSYHLSSALLRWCPCRCRT